MIDFSIVKSISSKYGEVVEIYNNDDVLLWQKPPSYDAVFANNTWEQIIDACQKNKVPDSWTVGSRKSMIIDGVNCTVNIIGKNHDTYANGSKAPLTFQLYNLIYNEEYDYELETENDFGWIESYIRTDVLPNFMDKMPNVVSSAIRPVAKKSYYEHNDPSMQTTYDGLFLLSEIEVTGSTKNSKALEGEQYKFYQSYSYDTSIAIKYDEYGDAGLWWLRSMKYTGNQTTDGALIITKRGKINDRDTSTSHFVAPAFCF